MVSDDVVGGFAVPNINGEEVVPIVVVVEVV